MPRLSVFFLILITAAILFQLLSRLFDRVAQVYREKLGQKLAFSSEKKLYEKYETFDAGFLANPRNRRITHKMTTARKADQIYVLDRGKIIESGSHQTLLKRKGLYEKFWNLQVVD